MVPSNCTQTERRDSDFTGLKNEVEKRKMKKEKAKVLTASSDDRHNRGDLREGGEKRRTSQPRENKKVERKFIQIRQHARRTLSWRVVVIVRTLHGGCTHTLGSGDVNRAGDVGKALVHAHLQVDYSEKTHTGDWSSSSQKNATHALVHICLCADTPPPLPPANTSSPWGLKHISPSILSILATS